MPEELKCGTCTACCTVLAVYELKKKNYVRCCHLADNCSIYQQRPGSCRDWSCNWLLGLLGEDEDLRPDKLGLVITFFDKVRPLLMAAYEVWEGAANGDLATQVLNAFSAKFPICVVHPNGTYDAWTDSSIVRYCVNGMIEAAGGPVVTGWGSPPVAIGDLQVIALKNLPSDDDWWPPKDCDQSALAGNGTIIRQQERIGRNDPCPCGSGKKFKKCCRRR